MVCTPGDDTWGVRRLGLLLALTVLLPTAACGGGGGKSDGGVTWHGGTGSATVPIHVGAAGYVGLKTLQVDGKAVTLTGLDMGPTKGIRYDVLLLDTAKTNGKTVVQQTTLPPELLHSLVLATATTLQPGETRYQPVVELQPDAAGTYHFDHLLIGFKAGGKSRGVSVKVDLTVNAF
jgi:hypothetical protein